jgi:hypothetical protein
MYGIYLAELQVLIAGKLLKARTIRLSNRKYLTCEVRPCEILHLSFYYNNNNNNDNK